MTSKFFRAESMRSSSLRVSIPVGERYSGSELRAAVDGLWSKAPLTVVGATHGADIKARTISPMFSGLRALSVEAFAGSACPR